MKKIFTILLALAIGSTAFAQKLSFGTNAVDYLNLGTLNVEGHVAVSRHLCLGAQVRYNNWTYAQGSSSQTQNRKASYGAIMRFYPWYIYSGWFMFSKLQYQEYNRNDFLFGADSRRAEEGDAYGLGMGAGYDWLVAPNINLEVGAGVWGGYKTYTSYACPTCGVITGEGQKSFFLPDVLFVSVHYIF